MVLVRTRVWLANSCWRFVHGINNMHIMDQRMCIGHGAVFTYMHAKVHTHSAVLLHLSYLRSLSCFVCTCIRTGVKLVYTF